MKRSSPDTNIFIFHIVGGKDYQTKWADKYFEIVESKDSICILMKTVEKEFSKVIHKRISELRTLASKAKEHNDWETAKSFVDRTSYSNNFAEEIISRYEPEDAIYELNKFKRGVLASFERLKRKIKLDEERSIDEEIISKIKDKIPDKEKESEQEKKKDASLIYSIFRFCIEENLSLTIISDDKHIKDADYTEIEKLFEVSDFNKIVTCNSPKGYVKSSKN